MIVVSKAEYKNCLTTYEALQKKTSVVDDFFFFKSEILKTFLFI